MRHCMDVVVLMAVLDIDSLPVPVLVPVVVLDTMVVPLDMRATMAPVVVRMMVAQSGVVAHPMSILVAKQQRQMFHINVHTNVTVIP
jgi:hypothetical protein